MADGVAGSTRPLVRAGTVLGVGMGGFVDGILFHQILQLHSMLSNRIPRDSLVHEQINMFWDGVFHAFTWVWVAAGIYLLWKATRNAVPVLSGRVLWGAMLYGWGMFNVVEGVVDHELLRLHHVYESGNHLLWDMVFLAAGAALILAGRLMMRERVPTT